MSSHIQVLARKKQRDMQKKNKTTKGHSRQINRSTRRETTVKRERETDKESGKPCQRDEDKKPLLRRCFGMEERQKAREHDEGKRPNGILCEQRSC